MSFEWLDEGLCRQVDADVFFPEANGKTKAERIAIKVCRRCPVLAECTDYVLTCEAPVFGVWGAMHQHEIGALRYEAGLAVANTYRYPPRQVC